MKVPEAVIAITGDKKLVAGSLEPAVRLAVPLGRPLRVLLVKPYQADKALVCAPPLGLLYLAAELEQRFGSQVTVSVLDMKVLQREPETLITELRQFCPDIVGVSALNVEAAVAQKVALLVKQNNPQAITVLGGPYTLNRSEELMGKTCFDWIFSGPADNSFPEAIDRLLNGHSLGDDILGFAWRAVDGQIVVNTGQDMIKNLDTLPMPAWERVDFDCYARAPNMNGTLKGRRYATLFTSRGCPYLCNYCHDLFTKKFVYRSAENVIAEIALLHEQYGIDEFQIVDDIFNLHKPRLKAIMGEVARRWPGKLKFCFPNGLRADILDEEVLDALADAGTYMITVAIESATPRLQRLIEKDLDIGKTFDAIEYANKRGISVAGFFMLGFPTETLDELKMTIRMALESKLVIAMFFMAVPQPETPLYKLAMAENPDATIASAVAHESGNDYKTMVSWYERAYGVPLGDMVRMANLRFYLKPRRLWHLFRLLSLGQLLRKVWNFFPRIVFRSWYPKGN